MANSTQQSSLKVYLRLLKYVVPYWGPVSYTHLTLPTRGL